MTEGTRIGFYGGTFDPIHRGHLEPVLSIFDHMQWDEVVFIPAHRQPFKTTSSASSPFHRYAMTALATAGDPRLRCSSMELERGEISYTVDTLETLRLRYPTATLDWIIGEDNLSVLMSWKDPGRILELANFVVLRREGGAIPPRELAGHVTDAAGRGSRGSIVLAENARVDISATEIRRRVREGKPFAEFLMPDVARYVERYDLYRPEELN